MLFFFKYIVSVRFVGIEKICTAGLDGQAQIHDLETSKKMIDLKGHESGLNHCSVSESNPNLITTSSKDGSIRIWDCRNNRANILCVNTQHRQEWYSIRSEFEIFGS